MIQRQRFDVSTSSAVADTGPPCISGFITQVRFENMGSTDTGGDLSMFVQQREADTGDGVPVLTRDGFGADFITQPRSDISDKVGGIADTGAARVPVAFGERLRLRWAPAGGSIVGRLYVWISDD